MLLQCPCDDTGWIGKQPAVASMAVLNSASFADCPPTLVPPPPRPALPCPTRRQRVLPGGGRQHPAEEAGQEAVPIVCIERGRGGKPHEYPALPGDIHPAQISKAIRCAAGGTSVFQSDLFKLKGSAIHAAAPAAAIQGDRLAVLSVVRQSAAILALFCCAPLNGALARAHPWVPLHFPAARESPASI